MIYIPCPAGYETEGRFVCQFSDGGNCPGSSCTTYRGYLFDFLRLDVPKDFVPSISETTKETPRLSRDGIPLRSLS